MGKRTGNPKGGPSGSKNKATIERELRAAAGVKALSRHDHRRGDVLPTGSTGIRW
jgi:hypothetical protein